MASSSLYWRWIQKAVAAALIVLIFWWVEPHQVIGALANITLELLAFLIFLSLVLVYISVLKWKILLSGFSKEELLLRLFGLYLVGFFVNLLMPSYLGGDVVRSYYLGKDHGQHEALSATVFERYSGLVAMVVLAWIFMWQVPLITADVRYAIYIVSGLLFFGSVFVMSPLALRSARLIPIIGEKLSKHGGLLQESLFTIAKNPRVLFEAGILSFLFHSITVVNVIAAAWAVGWFTPPPYELFVVLPVILVVSAIPITPQGIGVQEGAFVYFLMLLGATSGQALGIALILRAKAYLLAMIGGIVWLSEHKTTAEA